MNHLAAFVLATAGFAALAMAMQRYQLALFGVPGLGARRRVALRIAGTAALALALALCLLIEGVGVGLVLWCALLTAAGWTVAVLLAWRARRPLTVRAADRPS